MDEKMSQTILAAIRETRVRAIVSKGWSKLGTGMHDRNVFFLDDCPHGRWFWGLGRTLIDEYGRMVIQACDGSDSPRWS
jgi:hypothetical protein